jgi:hypothetical protein
MLSEKAHYDPSVTGYLYKRTADLTKWQLRWFVLYQVNIIQSIIFSIPSYVYFILSNFSKYKNTNVHGRVHIHILSYTCTYARTRTK